MRAGSLDWPETHVATITCPPNGTVHSAWGHGLYTGDSSVCTAAVHAGLITLERGGTVTVEQRPGGEVYGSSTRNGIKTVAYGAWRDSFVFHSTDGKPVNLDAPEGTPISWDTNGGILPAKVGESVTLSCPPGGAAHAVWGSGNYTGDSSICTAGVHAGLITLERGGPVTVQQQGPLPFYGASAQNGITTVAYGAWRSTFAFRSKDGQTVGTETSQGTPILWATPGSILPPAVGESYTLHCPARGVAQSVWGSDIYTGNSSVCSAAVHAGAITLEAGGMVTVEQRGPQQTYGASTRNGITTKEYGAWRDSFAVRSKDGKGRSL